MRGYACACWRAGTGAVVNKEVRINEEAALVGGTSVGERAEEIKGPVSHLRCCIFENFFSRQIRSEKLFENTTSEM